MAGPKPRLNGQRHHDNDHLKEKTMAHGGLHAYRVSQELAKGDPPFSAFIFCAIRKADTLNLERLRLAFPELVREMEQRYWAPGGMLEGERDNG